jgi:hypothetical protein
LDTHTPRSTKMGKARRFTGLRQGQFLCMGISPEAISHQ